MKLLLENWREYLKEAIIDVVSDELSDIFENGELKEEEEPDSDEDKLWEYFVSSPTQAIWLAEQNDMHKLVEVFEAILKELREKYASTVEIFTPVLSGGEVGNFLWIMVRVRDALAHRSGHLGALYGFDIPARALQVVNVIDDETDKIATMAEENPSLAKEGIQEFLKTWGMWQDDETPT